MTQENQVSREINVLVAVDVNRALATRTLSGCIFFIDSNGYFGSYNQGTPQLVTKCNVSERIKWRVVPISPNDQVEISSFVGTMITSENCVPEKKVDSLTKETYWEGTVQAKSSERGHNINYTLSLKMTGVTLKYDPAIWVNP